MNNKSITDFIKPTIITAQQYGTKISVEIDHSDTDIDELMDAFQTLVIGLGYHDSAWKRWILDRADEYRETDAEDLKEKLTEWQTDEVADVVFHRYTKDEDAFSKDGGFDGKPHLDLNDESEYDDLMNSVFENSFKAAEKYKKKLK